MTKKPFIKNKKKKDTAFTKKVKDVIEKSKTMAEKRNLKYLTENLTANFSSVGNTVVQTSLSDNIAQGDLITNREGDKVRVHWIRIHGTLASGDDNNVFRIQVTDVDPNYALVTSLNQSVRATKIANQDEYNRTFFDKMYSMNCNFTGGITYKVIDETIKIDKVYQYADYNLEAIKSRIEVGMVSDSTVVAHPGFVSGYFEVAFSDVE